MSADGGTPEREPNVSFDAGQRFGPFLIVRVLGAGAMGSVYGAVRVTDGKEVALKLLKTAVIENDEARVRFEREALACQRIAHPHVVNVLAHGIEGKTPWFAMDLVEGDPLSRRIEAGAMDVASAVEVLLPVIDAIQATHDAGVIHRDIKPDNILLTSGREDGHPMVVDFGVSKVQEPEDGISLTASATLLGTPQYMSPEQAGRAKEADARSDQYSIGVIAYQMITGVLPFQQKRFLTLLTAICTEAPPPPSERAPGIPPALEAVVLKVLEKDPADRYDSLRDLGLALLPFAAPHVAARWRPVFDGSGIRDETIPPPPTSQRMVAIGAVAVFGLAAVALGLAAWLLL